MTSKKWLYAICETDADGCPSFRTTFLEGPETEDEAYDLAHARVDQPRGNGINDLVVEIGDFPADAEGIIR